MGYIQIKPSIALDVLCFIQKRLLNDTKWMNEKQIEEICYLHKKILNCIEEKDLVTLKDVVYSHNFSGIIGIEKVREKHPEFFE